MRLEFAARLVNHHFLVCGFLKGRVNRQGGFGIFGIDQPNHNPADTFGGRVHHELFRGDFPLGKAMILIFVYFYGFRLESVAPEDNLALQIAPFLGHKAA
jgi:hypothetical protein